MDNFLQIYSHKALKLVVFYAKKVVFGAFVDNFFIPLFIKHLFVDNFLWKTVDNFCSF